MALTPPTTTPPALTPVQDSLRRQRGALDARLAASTAPPQRLRECLAEAAGLAEVLRADDALVGALVGHAVARAESGAGRSERVAVDHAARACGPWLRADPERALAELHHAGRVLARRPGALGPWSVRLAAGAARTGDPAQQRALGVVAAWRTGLVRLRDAALELATGLAPAALAAVLEVADGRAALAANAADPWAWPGHGPRPGELRVVARAGGFTGFGGPFPEPPVVHGGDGLRWWVRAGHQELLVLWDVHGHAVLTPDGPVPEPGPPVEHGGELRLAGLRGRAPWVDTATGSAARGRTAVLSRAGSHHLDLLRAGTA